jgi:pantoate--beta-alanine ligase
MDAARAAHDFVVVSLFVNPMQFGPTEDLAAYPRDLAGDAAVAREAGVDRLFHPDVAEVYPDGPSRTTVHVAGLTDGMCGASRPTHFDGVTTVVTKLFSMVGPCHAYLGRKDFQQLTVIRRMVADLCLPVQVVGAPTMREPDGLAMSSRNQYLDAVQRARAPMLHQELRSAVAAIADGLRDAPALEAAATARLTAKGFRVDYFSVRRAEDLQPAAADDTELVVLVAARLGKARLIDNLRVTRPALR